MYSGFLLLLLTNVVLLTPSHGHLHLTILHTSDISSRFEQVNNEGTECTEDEYSMGLCYGGMARLATRIDEVRNERKGSIHTLLLDAGDMLIGEFFNIYRGNATANLMNRMGYDAMAIGNSEIAIGPDTLAPFLEMANFSVVSANLDASREPVIDGLFSKSAVITYINKDGSEEPVGIVGYTTERTNDIAYVRDAVFTDILGAVQAEVDALTLLGTTKIIVLGHSWGPGDISMDLEIARTVSGVDIVVGGGVDYFQFQGCPPDIEVAYDEYPIVITPDDDPRGKVLVVHNTIWGKYLGRLNVMFNEDGKISEWYGNPELMDRSIQEDPEILAEIMEFNEGVSNFSNMVVGRTHVLLEGYPRFACRQAECSMGNLITDAMRWKWVTTFDSETNEWNDVSFAVFNSGGIRSSIDQGDVRYRDIMDVLPFGNTFDTIELQGQLVLEMLEHSAAGFNSTGAFLQVAGMRVTYDVSKEPYDNRVVEVMVLCTECDFPEYVPLDVNSMYRFALPSFLAEGFDGYDVIADNGVDRTIGEDYVSVLAEYIAKFTPIIIGLDDRITIIEPTVQPTPPMTTMTSAPPTSVESTLASTTSASTSKSLLTSAAEAASTMASTAASTTGGGGGARPDKPRKQ